MTFSVRWKRAVRDELAEIWLTSDSPTRKAITAASYRIDVELAQNPDAKGESREGSRRIYFEAPLGVVFRVDQAKAIVYIVHVWKFE